VAADAGLT
jgi:hypothetical protein